MELSKRGEIREETTMFETPVKTITEMENKGTKHVSTEKKVSNKGGRSITTITKTTIINEPVVKKSSMGTVQKFSKPTSSSHVS